jgi:tetratricopeptide (TPR) repeat protein
MAEVYTRHTLPHDQPVSAGMPAANRRLAEDEPASTLAVLTLIDEHEAEQTRGAVYHAYALYLHMANRPQARLVVSQRAVELGRRLHDNRLLAQALAGHGMALFTFGRRAESYAAMREALPHCELSGDLGLLIDVLTTLVFAHVHRGEFDQGMVCNDRSLAIASEVGDAWATAWALERRAWIAKQTGDWASAWADLSRALDLVPDLAHETWFCCMRGELCLVEGAWDDATAFLEQAVLEAKQIGLVSAQVCANVFLAELDLLQDRPRAAQRRSQAALAQDAGDYVPVLLCQIARAQLQFGNVDEAAAISLEGLKRATEADDRLMQLEGLRVRALVATAQECWQDAARVLEEGITVARRIGFRYAEAQLLHACGLMHLRKGEQASARERLADAHGIFQRLGARKDLERIVQDIADLDMLPHGLR